MCRCRESCVARLGPITKVLPLLVAWLRYTGHPPMTLCNQLFPSVLKPTRTSITMGFCQNKRGCFARTSATNTGEITSNHHHPCQNNQRRASIRGNSRYGVGVVHFGYIDRGSKSVVSSIAQTIHEVFKSPALRTIRSA